MLFFWLGVLLVPSVQAEEAHALGVLRGVPVMPGGVIVDGRIEYEGGAVVVVPAIEILSFDSCPSGYVCLFANTNWQGTMVQFNSCCAWNNLSAYGFNNTASSWRNRLSVDAQIAKDPDGGGSRLCLNNGAYASSMPSGWDNSASSIRVRDAASYC
jgi:hypothetical protein